MTPEISTRLAVSPMPEIASRAGSRGATPEYSPAPSRVGAAPPDTGPSFFDSNPSDPINPDLTHHFAVHRALRRYRNTRSHLKLAIDAARISSNQKITLP